MDDNFTTPWSTAKNLARKLKVGDLIEIRSTEENETQLVTHWGVYVGIINGNHKIGHLVGYDNNRPNLSTNVSSSDSTRQSTVRIDNLFDVCDKKECRKNNYIDMYLEPLPEKIIMYRVRSRLGSYGRSLFSINSAQFAKWTRYDVPTSRFNNLKFALVLSHEVYNYTKSPLIGAISIAVVFLIFECYDFARKNFFVDSF
uniref:LRAT domain-containing protein n=1 Tax=Strongyloides papillosus TaxID=174720 RepID=A0A0N5BI20_STREA